MRQFVPINLSVDTDKVTIIMTVFFTQVKESLNGVFSVYSKLFCSQNYEISYQWCTFSHSLPNALHILYLFIFLIFVWSIFVLYFCLFSPNFFSTQFLHLQYTISNNLLKVILSAWKNQKDEIMVDLKFFFIFYL